ncbi:hypothetical protein BpHYR1_009377 [Brachionus plicatilis]|uniref:Uncharacterized protein n=1 Tax=Brachionus plicatilis TaxID=10195 RepID=A0A3M7QHG8_BRAPC|nr:hypothetical protein BpHYR1_009377 [Brachionus plicatilis]
MRNFKIPIIKKCGSCTLPGQFSMDNHICLIGGQIFYFIVHVFFQLSTNCPDLESNKVLEAIELDNFNI